MRIDGQLGLDNGAVRYTILRKLAGWAINNEYEVGDYSSTIDNLTILNKREFSAILHFCKIQK